MKLKSLSLVFFCLFFFVQAQMGQEVITDEEELQEIVLKEFPVQYDQFGRIQGISLNETKVCPLVIGVAKSLKPDNEEWEIFDFYGYTWPGHSEWWIAFIVANYGSTVANVRVNIEAHYNDGKSFWIRTWRKQIEPNRAMMYVYKVNFIKKTGLYNLIGRVYGANGLGYNNRVSSQFYCYEVWDF